MAEESRSVPEHAAAPHGSTLESATPTARQASSIALLAVVVVLILAVAAGVWWYAGQRAAASETDAVEKLRSLGAYVRAGQDEHVRTVNLSLQQAHENIDAIVQELPALGYLENLNARNAPLTDEHLQVIGQLDSLRSLDLTYKPDQPEGSETGELPAQSQITDAGMPHLTGLGNLISLDLYGSEVTDKGLESVAQIETLKILNIGGTKVTGDLAELLPLGNLEWLVAGDLVLSDGIADTLPQLPKLAKLTIPGATISEEALAELREKKPQLMIDLGSR